MSRSSRHVPPRLGAALVLAVLGATIIPVQAAARPAPSLPAFMPRLAHDPGAGRVLGGITDQGWPVVMAISKNEKQVVGTVAGIVLSCSSGQQFTVEDAWSRLRIGAAGTVHTSSAIRPSAPNSGTAISGGSRSMKGKLDRKTGNFTGVWHVQLNFTSASGPDQCDSGNVAFALKV